MIHYEQTASYLTQPFYNKFKKNKNRSIYNAIIKLNTISPLYMFRLSKESQDYALALKKCAIEITSILHQMKSTTNDSVFNLKKASSNNEKIAQVDILDSNYDNLPEEFRLKVNLLATTQINSGNIVSSNNKSLPLGSYAFSIEVENNTYEFEYNITEKTTNKETLIKLLNFINRSEVGIMASFVENHKNDTVQSILKSPYPGKSGELAFTIKDLSDASSRGIVEYFGLNNVLQYPTNSIFEINGITKESISNSFTYNKTIKITLNSVSNKEILISYIADMDSILDRFSIVYNNYNKLIELINNQGRSQRPSIVLKNELYTIYSDYRNELESCGLNLDSEGKMVLDKSIAQYAAGDGTIERLLKNQDGYINRLQYKINQIMLDPMNYLDKTVVTYPNINSPPFNSPYIISVYTGMIYNYYC